MKDALRDTGIRKAIAVYPVNSWLTKKGRGAKKQCAFDLFNGSSSKLSQLCSGKQIYRIPTEEEIMKLAKYMSVPLDELIRQAIEMNDEHNLLRNSGEAIMDYQKRHNLGDYRTHDSSDGHKMNLRAFINEYGYKIYYLHKGAESLDVEEMVVSPITKVEESGYDELRIFQEATKYNYSGTLISPPELYRTFIFLERKNENGLYKDRGLITLYFPQDRVLKKKEYFCGVGIMLSLDRNEKNKDILIQRVVMLREDHIVDDEAKTLIWNILNKPMNGGVLISVADTEQLHRELYKHYHKNDDEIS